MIEWHDQGELSMLLATVFNFSADQIERRKRILVLTFLVFAAMC